MGTAKIAVIITAARARSAYDADVRNYASSRREYKGMEMEPALRAYYQGSCLNKKKYPSLAHAASAASYLRENHENAINARPYQCPFHMDHFHVGNGEPSMEGYHAEMTAWARRYMAAKIAAELFTETEGRISA